MNKFGEWLLGTNDFPARWVCGNWSSLHGWVHIISDILVWGAYMTIPVILLYFLSKRKDLPFPKIIWLFGAFIAACGTVHLVEGIIYWVPVYRVSAVIKMITALVSWVTVFALIPLVPYVLTFRNPLELQKEIDKRIAIEKDLIEKSQQLEKAHAEVLKRQKEVEQNNEEFKKMNQLMVGREARMIELKKELKQLQEKLDQTS